MNIRRILVLFLIIISIISIAGKCSKTLDVVTIKEKGEDKKINDTYTMGPVTVDDLFEYISRKEELLILDVRTAEDFKYSIIGHIKSARNIPLDELTIRYTELHEYHAVPIYLIDRTGSKSVQAQRILAAHDFNKVFVVEGGMIAWQSAGFTVVHTDDESF